MMKEIPKLRNVNLFLKMSSLIINQIPCDVKKLIFAQLNINSLRNKFDFSVEFIRGKVDILMISEKKIDINFPLS